VYVTKAQPKTNTNHITGRIIKTSKLNQNNNHNNNNNNNSSSSSNNNNNAPNLRLSSILFFFTFQLPIPVARWQPKFTVSSFTSFKFGQQMADDTR